MAKGSKQPGKKESKPAVKEEAEVAVKEEFAVRNPDNDPIHHHCDSPLPSHSLIFFLPEPSLLRCTMNRADCSKNSRPKFIP
jgi:hypothetical protein